MKNNKLLVKTILLMLLLSSIFQNNVNAQQVVDLTYWESTMDRVSSWAQSPSAYVLKLNNHGSFDLQNYFVHAKLQWIAAGVYSEQKQYLGTNANIVCYGGYLAELRARSGIFIESTDYGVTVTTSAIYNPNISFSYNGQTKYHYKLSKATVCIVDRTCDENQFLNTFTHEYGHALGWDGHSQSQYYYYNYTNPQNSIVNVMYAHPTGTTTLSPADKRHLIQFY